EVGTGMRMSACSVTTPNSEHVSSALGTISMAPATRPADCAVRGAPASARWSKMNRSPVVGRKRTTRWFSGHGTKYARSPGWPTRYDVPWISTGGVLYGVRATVVSRLLGVVVADRADDGGLSPVNSATPVAIA